MNDLNALHSSELLQLQVDIEEELQRRKKSKKKPVFGVVCGFSRYEFMTLGAASICLRQHLPDAIDALLTDIEKGGLDGWNGDVVRLYVNHVSEEDFKSLEPGFFDNRYKK